MSSGRLCTDPTLVTIAALGREKSNEQFRAFIRFANNAKRFLEMYDNRSAWGNDTFTRYLSHEEHLSECTVSEPTLFELEDAMKRCSESYEDFVDAKSAQSSFNRIRLALMKDADFRDGEYWEQYLTSSQELAEKSKIRRR